jgi:hypothetical protein
LDPLEKKQMRVHFHSRGALRINIKRSTIPAPRK